jgi:hypothetical protein
MKRLLGVIGTVCIALIVAYEGSTIYCDREGLGSELLTQLDGYYPGLQGGIYQKLSVWEKVLGEPLTVPQKDGGHTYFYWPEAGIAAFAHPLFRGQYARRSENDRIVTSVIIPVERKVHPTVPPVDDSLIVEFARLSVAIREVSSFRLTVGTRSAQVVEERGLCGPFSKTETLFHYVDGRLSEIEMRDHWIFSRYD